MDIIYGLPDANIASLVFAVVSSTVLIVVKELNARYRHKLPFPIPVEIIVVSSWVLGFFSLMWQLPLKFLKDM